MRFVTLAAIAACSTYDATSQIAQQALSQSQSAITIVQDLRKKFVLRYEVPPSLEELIADNDKPTTKTAPVLVASEVQQVQQANARLSPAFAGSPSAAVTLPDRAAGGIELSAGNAVARVSLVGAGANAVAELGDGYIVYANGAPGGGHVLHLATKEGVEDFVTFASAPATPAVDYSLELVSGVAGLRLVDGTLELLDNAGAPRLRVRRPYLVDSTGKGVSASLSVSGCAVDSSPRGPWGRAVTAPGAAKCTVRVAWSNAGVTYPAILDPSWSATGNMVEARADHTATLLDDGKVLATCGYNAGPSWPGAELYDPSSGTWAATGSPARKRTDHVAAKLANGQVLIAGGTYSSGLTFSELYSPSTGTWSATGSLNSIRRVFIAERLANGKVLVAGGYTGRGILATAELYDPSVGTWSFTGSMSSSRAAHRSSVLVNDNVMVTGGTNGSYLASAETYSPSGGTWSSAGTMTTARGNHGQVSLAFGGRVVVGGGYNGSAATTSVERWDPTTNTWSAMPSLANARTNLGAALAGGSQVLFAGGQNGGVALSSTELLDSYPPTVKSQPSLVSARSNFPLLRLQNGKLLACGGLQGSTYLAQSEFYDPSDPAPSADGLPEQNSPSRLSMEWDSEDPLGTYSLSSATLGATVKNNTDESRTAYVDIVAVGLDQREATRSAYFNVTVPAWGSVSLSVPMSAWPIRSVGTESEVKLKLREYVTGTGETGFIDYTTERRYEVNASYTTVTLHGIQGKDLDRTQPSASASTTQWLASLDSAKGDLRNLAGTVWNGSDFVDVSTLGGQSNGSKGEYSWRGRLAGDISSYFNSFTVNYTPPGGSPSYTMCTRWRGKFIDASTGSELTTGDHKASYAWGFVRVWTCGGVCPWIAWVGQLDSNGCTPPIQIEAGIWADLVDVTYLKNTTTGTDTRVEFGTNSISNIPVFGQTFTGVARSLQVPGSGGTYTYVTNTEDFNTRSAAVLGRAMAMQDHGFVSNTTYQVTSNTGCGCGQPSLYDQFCKPQEACGGVGQTLKLGWVLLPSQASTATCSTCSPNKEIFYNRGQKHNTQYKAVIAHELGHTVQAEQSGVIWAGAAFNTGVKPGTPPFQCTCDFVQEGNLTHCLQSREEQRVAITEGYAHFYASRVSNDLTQPACAFPYYKTTTVFEYNAQISAYAWVPKAPPQSVTCTGPASNGVGWMEDQCKNNGSLSSIANRGTEWDWLTFLYDVSRPGSSSIPFTDPSSSSAGLTRVWRNACGNGSWTNACGTGNPATATTWFAGFGGGQGLQSSVTQLAGLQQPQLLPGQRDNFISLGRSRGVNH